MKRIHLDWAAGAPLLADASRAMEPWLEDRPANASSLHADGRQARAAIDEAREACAEAAGCLFGEFLFTSGGTESDNAAILGAALAAPDSRRRILLGAAEHHAVLHTRPMLERLGFRVDLVPVDRRGSPRIADLADLLAEDVALVSLMAANNETGVRTDLVEVRRLTEAVGAWMHTDAVQTFPEPIPAADLVSVSAHKIGGPQGVGGLVIRNGLKIKPWIVGGGQEREMRAGTENVAAIVGFGAAVRAVQADSGRSERRGRSRDRLRSLLGDSVVVTAEGADVLSGHLHVRAPGRPADRLLIRLDQAGINAGSGAACSSGSLEPSHVLLAAGYSESEAKEGLRFTLGPDHPDEEIDRAARLILACL